tara:strand:+ start:2483 stop:3163 length:681 start_codon:yes stop_codon:yes gene_type:complete
MAGIVTAAIIGGVGAIAGGIIGGNAARKERRRAEREKTRLLAKMSKLEANRQDVINPYEGIESLSSMISNPMAQLSVATKAAEIQIEEADISLANTLDTLRATGASAGGATALANAALRSKRGVAASIETQEKANEDKRAAGEQRVQNMKMSEEQRMQNADVAGRSFVYSENEKREMGQLNRVAGQLGMAESARAQSLADETSATLGMISGVTNAVGGAASGGAFG